MNQLKRIGLIFNPVGGSNKKGTVTELRNSFPGIEVKLYATTPEPGSATTLARQAIADGCDLVIAVGGDGTACQVAEALVGTDIPMAVFPGGTGNLFARSFYAVPTPQQFANMVLSGQPQPIDMIELTYKLAKGGEPRKRLFMVTLGLGKVSDAISDASPMLKRLLGKLIYVLRVTIACFLPDRQKLSVAGVTDATSVFVINATPPSMAMLSRGANASDGYMDVAIVRCRNPLQYLTAVGCLVFGAPDRSSHYSRVRVKELTVTAAVPVRPNIDGDPAEATQEMHMRLVPGAVKIVLSH